MALSLKQSDWLNPPRTVRAIICHVSRGEEFLLQLKSKGRFGEGFWNAPGGKIQTGETPEEAARREVEEETGLVIKSLEKVGELEFFFGKSKIVPDWTAVVLLCKDFEGKQKHESSEGELKWYRGNEIPYDKMWSDDKYWLPVLIERAQGVSRKTFRGTFIFSDDSKDLLEWKVELSS
jgi:8-oxo-dGTP diphosphatase